MGILGAVLRVSSEEHAKDDHYGWDRCGENGGRGILVVVVELSNKHAGDDIQTLEGANCEACIC